MRHDFRNRYCTHWWSFSRFLPIVVDVETGGFDNRRDALLELAMVVLRIDEKGELRRYRTYNWHIEPFLMLIWT